MLDQSAWLSDASKFVAYSKLDGMTRNLAYPEFLLNDTLLTEYYKEEVELLDEKNLVQNLLTLIQTDHFRVTEWITRKSEGADRTNFGQSPLSVRIFFCCCIEESKKFFNFMF